METKKKVLLTCPEMLPRETIDWLKEAADLRISDCAMGAAELTEALAGIDVIVIGGEEFYTLEALKRADSGLKAVFVGVQGDTSFTPEALEYLGKDNLLVTGGGLKEVARWASETIANPLLRKALITQRTRSYQWVSISELAKEFRPLSELEVSVIGAGGIGAQVLRFLEGKVGKLAYHDPMGERKDLTSATILWEPDLTLAFQADFVSLHLRLAETNRGIVNYTLLSQIRKGGWFLNPSRAGLVGETDLLQYLARGGKAVWDVFYKEGKDFESLKDGSTVWAKILESPGFFLTSHTAAFSRETIAEYGQGLEKVMQEKIL